MEYLVVKDLPEPVRLALKALGYARTDISVYVERAGMRLGDSASDGEKACTTLVNLTTGAHVTSWGSWGGPNMFDRTNAVDNDTSLYTLPGDGVVIKGHGNGERARWASLHIPASMTSRMISPQGEALPELLQWVLNVFVGNTSAGRKYEWERSRRTMAEIDSATAELVAGGFLKQNKAGAVSVTTKGRNARTD